MGLKITYTDETRRVAGSNTVVGLAVRQPSEWAGEARFLMKDLPYSTFLMEEGWLPVIFIPHPDMHWYDYSDNAKNLLTDVFKWCVEQFPGTDRWKISQGRFLFQRHEDAFAFRMRWC